MTTGMLDPRVSAWLESGPTSAPPIAFEELMAAVAATPQDARRIRVGGRVLPVTRPRLLLAAAVIVAAVATGVYLRGTSTPDVATPPDPTSLLAPFPDATVVVEREGGPSTAADSVSIATLPRNGGFVVAASCTGGGQLRVDHWDRSIEWGPDVPEAERMPNDRLEVPCDGTPATTRITTVSAPTDENELVLEAPAGATWRVAVGQEALPEKPSFEPIEVGEGALVLMNAFEPMMTGASDAGGIGVQVPQGVDTVRALVQCLGAPLDVTTEAGAVMATVQCEDTATTHRVDFPVTDATAGYLGIHVAADGFTWYRLSAGAVPAATAPRPTAPPLPDGLGDVRFADGDDSNVAFGSLGSNVQVVKALGGRPVGSGVGDLVAIRRPNATGETLELWRMSDASPIGTLAAVTDGQFFTAWIDEANEQVFYGLSRFVDGVPTGEWHRVALDGTGDVEVATAAPINEMTFAQERFAVDGSAFVAQWCLPDRCERTIYDAVTGEVERVELPPDPPCWLVGVAAGRLVTAAEGCDGTGPRSAVVEDLDGGSRTAIRDQPGNGEVVATSARPVVVFTDELDETHTVVSVMDLDGSNQRELWVSEHPSAFAPQLSTLRLPAGDWILLAGPLGDTPINASIGRPVPVLLNVVTGERIELPNLPSSG
ncbi:MAG TPA: hypothetical protein VFY23_00470 [Candidatus Limnocylindrales bacterium]|nr:hypothetical protein [Candidatus Limnocylindrales bacterium]